MSHGQHAQSNQHPKSGRGGRLLSKLKATGGLTARETELTVEVERLRARIMALEEAAARRAADTGGETNGS